MLKPSVAALNLRDLVRRLNVQGGVQGAHAAFLRLMTTAISLIFGIFGARLLGADVFGAYVSLMAVAGLATVATSVGLPALLAREIAASRGSGNVGALKPLAQGLVVVNATLGATAAGAWAMGWADIGLVLALTLAGNGVGILAAAYVGQERVLLGGWLGGVVRPMAALAALWLLAQVLTPSARLPLVAQIAGALIASVALLVFWRGPNPIRAARRAWQGERWSERHATMLRAGVVFAVTQILINLTTQIDILILTVMVSAEEVAHYYAAARAALVVSFFFTSSAMLAEPALARLLAQGDMASARELTRRTAHTGIVLTAAAAIVALLVAPYYLTFYGPAFTKAVPAMVIVIAGVVGWSLCGPAPALLRAARCEAQIIRITAIVLMVNALLSVCLIPVLGITGAAIGTACHFVLFGALLSRAAVAKTSVRTWAISSAVR